MSKLSKFTLQISGLFLLAVSFCMCSNDDAAKLEEKWQMRQVIHSNGRIEPVDSVFYNFMKGTFSATCILEGGKYSYYNGTYSLSEGVLKVSVLDADSDIMESPENTSSGRHMHWNSSGKKEFQLSELSGSSLRLVSGDYTFVFRKY